MNDQERIVQLQKIVEDHIKMFDDTAQLIHTMHQRICVATGRISALTQKVNELEVQVKATKDDSPTSGYLLL